MKAEHKNPFDLLGEIELNAGTQADLFEETDVFADLRFDEDELDIEDLYSVSISLTRAYLELELWGNDILPGTRLNDASKPAIERELTKRRSRVSRAAAGGEISADLSDRSFFASGKGEASVQGQVEEEDTISQKFTDPAVKCRSGKRWLIEEPGGQQPLSGTYISNDRLCAIQAHEHTNNVEVLAKITARRRDFLVEPEGNSIETRWRKLKHQQKFIAAILAKAIVETSGQEESELTSGRIILGQSKLCVDDDDHEV